MSHPVAVAVLVALAIAALVAAFVWLPGQLGDGPCRHNCPTMTD